MAIQLYYCKDVEDYTLVISQSEGYQGGTLDGHLSVTADPIVLMERLRTAQSEVEAILCNRFSIPVLRQSNAEFLRYATAIIAWWHSEINGKGRDLVRQKYEDLLKKLESITSIVDADGNVILSGVDAGLPDKPVRRSRVLGGKRPTYQSDTVPGYELDKAYYGRTRYAK
jgi:phage gp36-like protein